MIVLVLLYAPTSENLRFVPVRIYSSSGLLSNPFEQSSAVMWLRQCGCVNVALGSAG